MACVNDPVAGPGDARVRGRMDRSQMLVERRQVAVAATAADRAAGVLAAYDAYEHDLFTFSLTVTRDHAAAEDLVQEAFMRLVREAHAGRFPDNARAWLYRVVVNLARSRARRRAVADRWRHLFANRDVAESPENDLVRREGHMALADALAALPVEPRMALLLAGDGYSGQEIARMLGRSEGATRTLLWRARRDLRRRLEREASA
jgi:RNA polymerase sigma factor (sigma-70 family)